ncbi:hypothetical protein JCM10450v2_008035 [Rhodotorula kratochvilovae]
MTPPSPRPAIATRLPPELLGKVFDHCARGDAEWEDEIGVMWLNTSSSESLWAAALVCRSWREPAQRLLFRSIHFREPEQCEAFLRVVEERPDLAEFARSACVDIDGVADIKHREVWQDVAEDFLSSLVLAIRSCKQLRHLKCATIMRSSHAALIGAVESLPLETLVLQDWSDERGRADSEDTFSSPEVFHMAAKPSLRRLKYSICTRHDECGTDFAPPAYPTSSIDTLHILLSTTVGFNHLLHLASSTLRALWVYAEIILDPVTTTTALQACTSLTELRLSIYLDVREVAGFDGSWVEPMVRSLKSLRKLSITDVLVDLGEMLVNPPPRLGYLEWNYRSEVPNPERIMGLFEAVEPRLQRRAARQRPLRFCLQCGADDFSEGGDVVQRITAILDRVNIPFSWDYSIHGTIPATFVA